ncbi:YopX family protein [uncultured Limosilactobacillus sp.]|uniref:YopX family protein n=1 Tax=uncultured Limosilactobacillus sp. TaxID=2837629 RepID=UPI0025DD8B28|nr:YopX family protein [uncultured Limosilactobacillus sp.]
MKDIRFREYDSHNTELMTYSTRLDQHNQVIFTFEKQSEMLGTIVNEQRQLMQFTGVKDRDGQSIYEGDIVEIQAGNGFVSTDTVRFAHGQFLPGT